MQFGGRRNAENEAELLERTKVTHILNCAQELRDILPLDLKGKFAEREVLAGSGWLELVGRYEAEMCDDWRALGKLAGSAANAWEAFVAGAAITLDAYKWAYATVKSRSAEVDVHGVPTKLRAVENAAVPSGYMFRQQTGMASGRRMQRKILPSGVWGT